MVGGFKISVTLRNEVTIGFHGSWGVSPQMFRSEIKKFIIYSPITQITDEGGIDSTTP